MATAGERALERVIKARRVGSWTLTHQLGRGGFGVTWRGERRTLEGRSMEAAVKLMLPRGDDARADFVREFRILRALDNPYIAKVLDGGVEESGAAEVHWFATELIRGDSLQEEIARHGPLDEIGWLESAHDILSALVETHASGLVHRDLKPANRCAIPAEAS